MNMMIETWVCLLLTSVMGQFSSGSDGSDGALSLDDPGDFFFSAAAFNPPLDQDGDGIFHFTSINIASGVRVRFPANLGPVIWLASESVRIDGTLDLNGQDGHEGFPGFNSRPGPGGFSGGMGGDGINPPQPGYGPGRGLPSSAGTDRGSGAGHSGIGQDGDPETGGMSYGNPYLLPLIGGSGGAGGGSSSRTGSGGGAGGGAIMIASSEEIIVGGRIEAKGGSGGVTSNDGGGGSGGAIRLVAPVVRGLGQLNVSGGTRSVADGAPGRIRIEGGVFDGSLIGSSSYGPPGLLFLSGEQLPVRIVRINGVDVPNIPKGGFFPPDVVISSTGSAIIEIAARGVPLGTVITLNLIPEVGDPIVVESTPLAGTVDSSTATASVTVPFGFSRFFVQADW